MMMLYVLVALPVAYVLLCGYWVHRHPSAVAKVLLYAIPHVALLVFVYGMFAFHCTYVPSRGGAGDWAGIFVLHFIILSFYSLLTNFFSFLYVQLLNFLHFLYTKRLNFLQNKSKIKN